MSPFAENLTAKFVNLFARSKSQRLPGGMRLGHMVVDGRKTEIPYFVPIAELTKHLGIFGKTGSGKSSLEHGMAMAHVRAARGWFYIDRHGESTNWLLGAIAQHERQTGEDLSDKLIVIRPSDPKYSVGFNLLDHTHVRSPYVLVAEIVEVLKQRWDLNGFGARTEELLRNTILVLFYNELTLLEAVPVLSAEDFLLTCLKRVPDEEVRNYFELRYLAASEQMRAVLRDPILNKVTAFVSDPAFRHLLGQKQSTFLLVEAMDQGKWIILSLPTDELGEQAGTVASLFLLKLKNAVFARRSRTLFTLFLDEVQTLVANASSIETLAAEGRKFAAGLVTANQFLDQLPASMRSALLSLGTHCFFQTAGNDAHHLANFLDGGKPLVEQLKNLPQRHLIVKSGHYPLQHVVVPNLNFPTANGADLYRRSLAHYARKRSDIEAEIRSRSAKSAKAKEALDAWE